MMAIPMLRGVVLAMAFVAPAAEAQVHYVEQSRSVLICPGGKHVVVKTTETGRFEEFLADPQGWAFQKSWLREDAMRFELDAARSHTHHLVWNISQSRALVTFEITEPTEFTLWGEIDAGFLTFPYLKLSGPTSLGPFESGSVRQQGVLPPGAYTLSVDVIAANIFNVITEAHMDIRFALPSPGSGAFIATGAILLARRRRG